MNTLISTTADLLADYAVRCREGSNQVQITGPGGSRMKDGGHHSHAHPEIFLQVEGENHFSLPGAVRVTKPGDCLYMPAGVPHAETVVDCGQGFNMLVLGLSSRQRNFIYVEKGVYDRFPVIEQVFSTPNPQSEMLRDLLTATESFLREPETLDIGRQLLASVFDYLQVQLRHPDAGKALSPDIGLAAKAGRVVQARFFEADCNVAAIARELGVSPNHLSARFRAATGKRLSRVLLGVRLEHAVVLLLETEHPVHDISSRCGFSDCSHFIARFKAQYGMSPMQYRLCRS